MIQEKLAEMVRVAWNDFNSAQQIDWNKIQVFKIDVKQYYAKIAADFDQILSATEMYKSKSFLRQADAQRYISARHAIRQIISMYTKHPPCSVIFTEGDHKKPETAQIHFNISHSNNCIMIVLSKSPLGIDVEYLKDFDIESLFQYCFDEEEVEYIRNAKNKRAAFYTLWTRKEAILKASGEGLVDNLLEINCLQDVICRLETQYILSSWKLNTDYIFSLASPLDVEKQFWAY